MKNKQYDFEERVIASLTDEYIDTSRIKTDRQVVGAISKIAGEALAKYSNRDKRVSEHKSEMELNERKLAWATEKQRLLDEKLASFPPLPLLPPPDPLIKISGTVEEVTFTKAMACFDAGAYSTMQERLQRKHKIDEIGTIAAMTAQALAGNAPHVGENEKFYQKQKSLYVKGKIDGKSFSGWFGMTNIRPGDKVEMAVMPDGDNYLVYAITNPEQRTISVTPGCNSGGSRWTLPKSILAIHLFFFIPYVFFFLSEIDKVIVTFGYVLSATTFGFYMYRIKKYTYGEQFKMHNRIIETLDISSKKEFDLLQNSWIISNSKRKIGKIIPRRERDVQMPQAGGKDYWDEYFYYY